MALEQKIQEIVMTVSCLLYGFLIGYLLSEMIYQGAINVGMVAGGIALGYFLKVLLFREAFEEVQ